MNYEKKYLKYKQKYANLLEGGGLFTRSIKRGPYEHCTYKRFGSECSKGYKCSSLELDKNNINIINHKKTICINKYAIPTKKQISHYKFKKADDKDESSDDDEDELL
jgi:hypothetical protein